MGAAAQALGAGLTSLSACPTRTGAAAQPSVLLFSPNQEKLEHETELLPKAQRAAPCGCIKWLSFTFKAAANASIALNCAIPTLCQ